MSQTAYPPGLRVVSRVDLTSTAPARPTARNLMADFASSRNNLDAGVDTQILETSRQLCLMTMTPTSPPADHRDVTSVIGAPLRQQNQQINATTQQNCKADTVADIFTTIGSFACTSRHRNESHCAGEVMSSTSSDTDSLSSMEKNRLYKTEMCRTWTQKHTCNYGDKCQYAHGEHELRQIPRHPKYKTDLCRTFSARSYCPYGPRCHFIHGPAEAKRLGMDYQGLILRDEQLQKVEQQQRRQMSGYSAVGAQRVGMNAAQQMYPLVFNNREQSLSIDQGRASVAQHMYGRVTEQRSSIGASSGNGDSLHSGSASPTSTNSHSPGLQVTTDDEAPRVDYKWQSQWPMHSTPHKNENTQHAPIQQTMSAPYNTPYHANMDSLQSAVDNMVLRKQSEQQNTTHAERLPIFAQLSSIGVNF